MYRLLCNSQNISYRVKNENTTENEGDSNIATESTNMNISIYNKKTARYLEFAVVSDVRLGMNQLVTLY